jgi:23S rRNA (guanine2445-N2)-methyltransferase / 23S rRNA (guanine2069-N7)-methyltransferase
MTFSVFISCPKGLEYLLEEELKSLNFASSRVSPNGVYGEADLSTLYRVCLWSRIASRVQVILLSGNVGNQQSLYQLCREFAWETIFSFDKTLNIEFHGSSAEIRNSMFGAQVIKDAIADYFREQQGARPSIVRDKPQIRLHAHLKQDRLTLSFDVTGYSLHQRGYRLAAGTAPLKENIAAAMLIRAKWPQLHRNDAALHDPFCGSGTLVIEAALMAANIAPGLLRNDQSLHDWAQHQPAVWAGLCNEAMQQKKSIHLSLLGTDNDANIIKIARANAARAGVDSLVTFDVIAVEACKPAVSPGLLICNPPYGERLGNEPHLVPLYQQLGHVLHQRYQGWQAAILNSSPLLVKATGLRATKQYTLFNGALECKLYCIELNEANQLKNNLGENFSPGAKMFANRLKKNYLHLQKWAKRNQITCYRVYDADLPEYAYAIDLYNDYAVLQEYVAPASIAPHLTEKRSLDVLQAVPSILGLHSDHIVVKQRQQQKGTNQYQKINQTSRAMHVREGDATLKVNLYDYLDTGLFLDHRLLRLRFAQLPANTRFLNCFCYTATASVHAALNGALTTNVDLSNTYLTWAKDNFKLNKLDLSRHQFIQYDCLDWLNTTQDRFDIIFLDPPSFSNSKRMQATLDIQRDHAFLINSAMRVLNSQGILYFSTNFRQFKLSQQIIQQYDVHDISAQTIDLDYKRNQRIHQCFSIRSRAV